MDRLYSVKVAGTSIKGVTSVGPTDSVDLVTYPIFGGTPGSEDNLIAPSLVQGAVTVNGDCDATEFLSGFLRGNGTSNNGLHSLMLASGEISSNLTVVGSERTWSGATPRLQSLSVSLGQDAPMSYAASIQVYEPSIINSSGTTGAVSVTPLTRRSVTSTTFSSAKGAFTVTGSSVSALEINVSCQYTPVPIALNKIPIWILQRPIICNMRFTLKAPTRDSTFNLAEHIYERGSNKADVYVSLSGGRSIGLSKAGLTNISINDSPTQPTMQATLEYTSYAYATGSGVEGLYLA